VLGGVVSNLGFEGQPPGRFLVLTIKRDVEKPATYGRIKHPK
jgi:hypothetical protein